VRKPSSIAWLLAAARLIGSNPLPRTALLAGAALAATAVPSELNATDYTIDFTGGGGSNITAAGTSTTLIATPSSGSEYFRVGSAGGSIILANPGNSSLGSGNELQITAPTSTSANLFHIQDWAGATTSYAVAFQTVFTGYSGVFHLSVGNGTPFDGTANTGPTAVTTATSLYFTLGGTAGAPTLATTYGSIGKQINTGLTTSGLVINSVLDFHLFGNNASATTVTYSYNGSNYTIAPGMLDIWSGTTRIAAGVTAAGSGVLGSSALSLGTVVDSLMFDAVSSTANVGVMAIDNLVYSNDVPAAIVAILYFNGSGWTSTAPGAGGAGSWSDGSGSWVAANTATFGGTGSSTVTVGTVTANNGLNFVSSGYLLSGGTITLGGTGVVTTAASTSTTINSILAGSVGLNKDGAGTLTIGGANIYSGNTTVTAGTLITSGGNGRLSGNTSLTVASGATLTL